MAKKKESSIVLWPDYFDSTLSRSQGRRVPRDIAVSSPQCEKIFDIARKIGMSPKLENDRARPYHQQQKKGRVLVKKVKSKTAIIMDIAKGLDKKR